MYELICPMCGQPIDASGPGVASHHPDHDPDHGRVSSWVPFIEDLRGTPARLVHPTCYANDEGIEALIAVVHAHDEIVRRNEYRRWRKDQGLD